MKVGTSYKITNTVVEFEEGERIAWRHFHGHRWRYEFADVDGGTEVTETFDWSTREGPCPRARRLSPSATSSRHAATLERLDQLRHHGNGRRHRPPDAAERRMTSPVRNSRARPGRPSAPARVCDGSDRRTARPSDSSVGCSSATVSARPRPVSAHTRPSAPPAGCSRRSTPRRRRRRTLGPARRRSRSARRGRGRTGSGPSLGRLRDRHPGLRRWRVPALEEQHPGDDHDGTRDQRSDDPLRAQGRAQDDLAGALGRPLRQVAGRAEVGTVDRIVTGAGGSARSSVDGTPRGRVGGPGQSRGGRVVAPFRARTARIGPRPGPTFQRVSGPGLSSGGPQGRWLVTTSRPRSRPDRRVARRWRSASSWPSQGWTVMTEEPRSSRGRCGMPGWRSSTPACTRHRSRSCQRRCRRTPRPSGSRCTPVPI
jgi:hypothetical protein